MVDEQVDLRLDARLVGVLVNLGQRQAFSPVGFGQWLSYFLIAAGWILATTIAAAVTRILRRQ